MNAPRVVMTSGVWDLLHVGHLRLLWASKALGDMLVVGVVSDDGCKAYKGIFPTENVVLRVQAVARLGFVDMVLQQAGTDPTDLLERFRPDVFTHGSDWDRLREGHETLGRLGIEYVSLPYTKGISSTALREAAATIDTFAFRRQADMQRIEL